MKFHHPSIPQLIISDNGPGFLTADGKRLILRTVMDAMTRAVVSWELLEAEPTVYDRTRSGLLPKAGGR